jgi:hypothetical protein
MRIALAILILGVTATSWAEQGAVPAQAVDVSFSLCDGMVCVLATLSDGKSHVMLLDTGNLNSWLSAKTARSLGMTLEPVMSEEKLLPGIFRLGAQTIALGGKPISARFLALDDSATGELPRGVDGAIAYTAFKDRVLVLDYPRHRLRVVEALQDHSNSARAAMKLMTFGSQGPPIVVIEGLALDGHAFAAQFDSCFSGTLVVYDAAIEQLGLHAVSAHGRPQSFPYTDGGVTLNAAPSGRITFEGGVLLSSPAMVYFPVAGKHPVHQPDGLFEATAGNALFAHSIVTLDFKLMSVYVRTQRPS